MQNGWEWASRRTREMERITGSRRRLGFVLKLSLCIYSINCSAFTVVAHWHPFCIYCSAFEQKMLSLSSSLSLSFDCHSIDLISFRASFINKYALACSHFLSSNSLRCSFSLSCSALSLLLLLWFVSSDFNNTNQATPSTTRFIDFTNINLSILWSGKKRIWQENVEKIESIMNIWCQNNANIKENNR